MSSLTLILVSFELVILNFYLDYSAGQVLANLKALDSDYFCKNHMKLAGRVGKVIYAYNHT